MAGEILRLEIKGLPVRKVLLDEAADIQQEIYLGIVVDRAARRPVMMASSEGGVEIEEVARTNPEAMDKKVPDLTEKMQKQGKVYCKMPVQIIPWTSEVKDIPDDAELKYVDEFGATMYGWAIALLVTIPLAFSGS